MKKRQIIIVSVGLLIIVGSFAAMSFLGGQREEPPKEKPVEAKKYVKTEPVKYSDISTEIVTYGRVKASESVDLISEQAGRMHQGKVLLKEGQQFRKGDLLFSIDDKEAALKLRSQKSIFIKDLASIAPDIRIDFPERYDIWFAYYRSIDLDKPLKSLPGEMSEKEKTFLATKNILSSFYDIKSQEANLAKYDFYAPFNGSITEVILQSGSYVNPGNKIGHIIRSDKLEMKVDVTIDEIKWVKLGKSLRIDTQDGQQVWSGYVSRISEILNKDTQSIDVHIEIQGNNNELYDGQYLRATIPGRNVLEAMEIPRNAIVENDHVFIVQDSLLKMKTIDVHKINSQTVVFNGLEEGVDLVIEPLINATNDMKVFKLGEKEVISQQKESEEIGLTAAVANN
jgi:multidrug efflux pump subunit AcrA (membrane-fusion protein)